MRQQSKSVAVYELDNNEAAFSVAVVPFSARSGELLLVVGTASNTQLAPRSCSSGYLRVYAFTEGGSALELLHKVLINSMLPTFSLLTESTDRNGRRTYRTSGLSGTTARRSRESPEIVRYRQEEASEKGRK